MRVNTLTHLVGVSIFPNVGISPSNSFLWTQLRLSGINFVLLDVNWKYKRLQQNQLLESKLRLRSCLQSMVTMIFLLAPPSVEGAISNSCVTTKSPCNKVVGSSAVSDLNAGT